VPYLIRAIVKLNLFITSTTQLMKSKKSIGRIKYL